MSAGPLGHSGQKEAHVTLPLRPPSCPGELASGAPALMEATPKGVFGAVPIFLTSRGTELPGRGWPCAWLSADLGFPACFAASFLKQV